MSDYVKGIDTSAMQGDIDFNAVAASGIQFVIQRCYVGNDYRDVNYTKNVNNIMNANLAVGSYHFIYPLPDAPGHTNRNPVDQANLHFNNCTTSTVFIDIEWPAPQDFSKWSCSSSQINDWCLKYLETYTSLAGKPPIVYTYPWFAQSVNFSSDMANYSLWLASYEPQPQIPAPWEDWVVWQTGGGQSYHLPNGSPCDTDLAKDLSIFQ